MLTWNSSALMAAGAVEPGRQSGLLRCTKHIYTLKKSALISGWLAEGSFCRRDPCYGHAGPGGIQCNGEAATTLLCREDDAPNL